MNENTPPGRPDPSAGITTALAVLCGMAGVALLAAAASHYGPGRAWLVSGGVLGTMLAGVLVMIAGD